MTNLLLTLMKIKKVFLNLATIRSKILRNQIAGYITSKLKRDADQEKTEYTEDQTEGN